MANHGGDGFYSSKRMKNDQGQSVSVGRDDSYEDNRKVSPSAVVHVRGLMDPVTDLQLKQSVQEFGNVSFVMNFPNRKMALIEFENIESAIQLVNYAQTSNMTVNGRPAKFNYSVSQSIKRPASISDAKSNNVLLLTIMNPRHVISVEVIHAICSPSGNVLRIVIFRKNGVQAMVEYDCVESATKAKNALNGADIYSNSCTIRTEYAKPTTLTVTKNDLDTWDFTKSHGRDIPNQPPPRSQPLLADPNDSFLPKPFNSQPMLSGGVLNSYNSYSNSSGMGNSGMGNSGMGNSGMGMNAYDYDRNMDFGSQFAPDCVLMVYGINMDRMNCQRLFNLFCLYGNVLKVRFLKSKEGSAMVQMSDREGCERVIRMLNGATCFGQKLVISFSKQSYVQEMNNPTSLGDGSLSYQDFCGSKNNRYSSPDSANKNRVQPPTHVLYFFNAPPGIEEETLFKAFTDNGATPPSNISLMPPKSEKSSRGFLTWDDVLTCTEALVCGNNCKIPNPKGSAPYILKLAFSPGNYNS